MADQHQNIVPVGFTKDDIRNIEIVVEGIRKVCAEILRQELEQFVYDKTTETHRLRKGSTTKRIYRNVYRASTLYLTVSNPPSCLLENILRKIYWYNREIKKDLEKEYYGFIRHVSQLSKIEDADKLYHELRSLQFSLGELARNLETGAIITKEAAMKLSRKQWKPPKGYIGSKSIVNDHNVPRSTLQGWEERNPPKKKVRKDPQTGEKYYPEKWFERRVEQYERRSKT